MAIRQLVITKKLSQLKESLGELDFKTLDERKSKLELAIREAQSEDEFSTIDSELSDIEQAEKELEEKKAEILAKIEALEKELLDLDKEDVETPPEGVRTNMNIEMEQRKSLNDFARGRKQERNFTSVEAAAFIPMDIAKPEVDASDRLDLVHLVNVVPVKSLAGTTPIVKLSDSVMVSVAELEENPKLANPVITSLDYRVETYRGYIPVSEEAIADADYDLTELIVDNIEQQELNTKNAKIIELFKAATPKAVTGIDGLKTLLNVELPRKYGRTAVISASLYNVLDVAKDSQGRYLLQNDITAASGKSLLGVKLEVLDDEVIGAAAGDLVGFFGDTKRAVTLFDRQHATIQWNNHNIHGRMLMGVSRFQVVSADADAGFYVTFTPTPEV